MSDLRHLPPAIVREVKTFPCSTSKMKEVFGVLGIIFFLYLLLVLRTEYVKTRKLEHISQKLAQSEQDLLYLEKLDIELDARIRSLRMNY